MPKAKYNRETGLFEATCIHNDLNVYSISDSNLYDNRIIIERVYDGGGVTPDSEIFCCGEVENVFHWMPIRSELGYYVLDRKGAMIRLGAAPSGPVLVKMHFIPTTMVGEHWFIFS